MMTIYSNENNGKNEAVFIKYINIKLNRKLYYSRYTCGVIY